MGEKLRRSTTVLITGCSTGIGRATARRLAARGWPVVATARRLETILDLVKVGCRVRHLDLCDEASFSEVVAEIEETDGAIGVLVNNAGYGLVGPAEELDLIEVRREFETNLFGPLRLTQLVLPAMRRQGWGKVVNLSSVAGRITLPGGGAYHGSKHALEALSDALRIEVREFGIDVVVVEPGAISTRWTDTAVATLDHATSSPYDALYDAIVRRLRGADKGLLALAAGTPDAVALVIERSITVEHPRTRYVVPKVARGAIVGRRLLPDRAWDAAMRRAYGLPRRPAR
jgi:NAD(P)-dependent dehydrogenase (short-subunit alcohol dehydrogenase family)